MNKTSIISCLLWLALAAPSALAQQEVAGVGIDEKPGDALPLDAVLRDHNGKPVTLGDYFNDGKPVVLNLVYYGCPGICTEILGGTATAIDETTLRLGDEYRVVTISFDPAETPDLSGPKRENYLGTLQSRQGEEGWVFLTADQANIDSVTRAVGFRYIWNEETGLWVHDAAAILCTPEGRISRYFRGTEFDPQTLRLSLVEASGGKIGALSDQIWVGLCGYDPKLGKYVVLARTVITIGGAATILAVAGVVAYMIYLEHKRKKAVRPHAA